MAMTSDYLITKVIKKGDNYYELRLTDEEFKELQTYVGIACTMLNDLRRKYMNDVATKFSDDF